MCLSWYALNFFYIKFEHSQILIHNEDKELFCEIQSEMLNIGAKIGGGYYYSSKLKKLNYREAIALKEKSE